MEHLKPIIEALIFASPEPGGEEGEESVRNDG
jgi:hypothetical protein